MIVRLVLFAAAKEIVGAANLEVTLDNGATVLNLKQRMVDDYPALKELIQRSALSVDQTYASDDQQLTDGVEVGIIPPVSGG